MHTECSLNEKQPSFYLERVMSFFLICLSATIQPCINYFLIIVCIELELERDMTFELEMNTGGQVFFKFESNSINCTALARTMTNLFS